MSDASNLRQRRPSPASEKPVDAPLEKLKTKPKTTSTPHPATTQPSSYLGIFLSVALLAFTIGALRLRDINLTPSPIPPSAAPSLASSFRPSVAHTHLRTIAARPRWTGSLALDASLLYIRDAILAAANAPGGHTVSVETFTASGSHASAIAGHSVAISYTDVQSVVARVAPPGVAPDAGGALLINAHVDSAFGSPGASDNVVGVAVALEVLTAILRTGSGVVGLRRPVVFLFNGGEEPLLAGADGFIKNHRWAKQVAAHINLESVGSGETYALFQIGHGHAWLGRAYARAVKKPWANVGSAEVYERGLIPGDTDFRIFNQAGIPGYDFALIENGHVYHTIYDDVKHVRKRSLESGGRSLVVPLLLELAGEADAIGKYLAGDVEAEAAARVGFFDILGFFLVVYPSWASTAVNVFMLVSAVVLLSVSGKRWQSSGGQSWIRLRMFGSLAVSCLAGFASASFTALFYVHVLNCPIEWYGSMRYALAVFVPPFFVGATTALQYSLPKQPCNIVTYYNMLHATSGFYALIVAVATAFSLMSAYPAVILLGTCLFCAVGPLPVSWVGVRCLIISANVAVIGMPLMVDFLRVFLSLFGRSGSAPSDVLASLAISLFTSIYVLVPLIAPLAYAPAAVPRLRKYAFWIAFWTGVLSAMLDELTLPHRNHVYSKDAPKRVIACHFYAPQQSPSNILALVPLDVIPVDVNTTVRMLPFNDKNALAHTPVFGLNSTVGESARPLSSFLGEWSVFELDTPLDLAVPSAEVKEVEEYIDEKFGKVSKVTVEIVARDSMQITLRVPLELNGLPIREWSFDGPIRDMGDGGGAWVRHVGRGDGAEKLTFSVIVDVDHATGVRPPVIFDVTSSRPGKSRSKVLDVLYFPQWVAPVLAQSTGASFSL